MVKYIAKRVLMMIPVLLGVILLVFFIMNLASGNAVLLILGENATEEAVAVKTRELGLDRPILVRYAAYVADLVRGDMGTSYFSSRGGGPLALSRHTEAGRGVRHHLHAAGHPSGDFCSGQAKHAL